MDNIKIIASDLDGTILLDGAQKADETLMPVIDELSKKGIIFAPASGRQITSLMRLFAPVADKLMYIAENGALVKYQGKTLVKNCMDYDLAMDIINDVVKIPSCEILVSGEETAYISPKSEEYLTRMTKVVNYKTKIVKNFREIEEDILKVAVCDLSGIVNSKDYLIKTWSNEAEAVVSGAQYLDFMAPSVSKGDAMKKIQIKMGYKPENCMAFGDNYNDITLLDSVYYSYAMQKADPNIKKHARFLTSWVEGTIREKFKIEV